MRIRTRILLLIVITLFLSLGTMTGLAAYQIREAAIISLRRDQERTARLVAYSNLLASRVTVSYLADFLGAEIISFDNQLGIVASTFEGETNRKWAKLLLNRNLLSTKQTVVVEMTIDGLPWTAAVTPIAGKDQKIAVVALIYRGALINKRWRQLIRPWILSSILVTLLSIVGAVVVSRSVVRPLERLARKTGNLEKFAVQWRELEGQGYEVESIARTLADTLKKYQQSREQLAQAERLTALGKLSSALAHELRNPLASIRMILALEVERGDVDVSGLKLALREIERLSMSTTKLLSFVREPQLHRREFSLVTMVEELGELMQYQFHHLGITMLVSGSPEIQVFADSETTRHVVLNLIQNASQAMQHGGCVRCVVSEIKSKTTSKTTSKTKSETTSNQVQLQVIDEGRGIPEADREKIFEPFFSRREGGTGLGLAVSKAILNAHHATISVSENKPQGTIMTIRWPNKDSLESHTNSSHSSISPDELLQQKAQT